MPNIGIVQAGGPTAVINASLSGFLSEAMECGGYNRIIGFRNGIEGLIKGWTMDLKQMNASEVEALNFQPGAALGAGRFPLTPENLQKVKTVLYQEKIDHLVLVGGNGTMWSAHQIECVAPKVEVVGIPKTVDNDLYGTDHAPGYLSAAKFIAEGVCSLALDLWSMSNFERVRIVEVMGRNVGWLAASASLIQSYLPGFPILIYLPEQAFDLYAFKTKVQEILTTEPCVIVVISEGIKDKDGNPMALQNIGGNAGSKILGGVSQLLASELRNMGIPCRSENLGILQRANVWSVAKRDREEANLIGRKAVKLLQSGKHGVMVGLQSSSKLDNENGGLFSTTPLIDVAGRERSLNPEFFNESSVTEEFVEWLNDALGEPLVGIDTLNKVWPLANKSVTGR
ncbi:MAG: diphosphate--fructose-6-phosphate 1-phosphotransferase [Desulfitobacterium hafniense]|nr:diphosphate--fructose-6-phosphate 1-phosphotransferase [Desulfitobacterium hafniense]